MEQSILLSVKKNLGIEADDTAFDHDVLTFANTAFSTLSQLGVGPQGFNITDESLEWSAFLSDTAPHRDQLNRVKTFVYLSVRMMFDPPSSSYTQTAFQRQIDELIFRLSVDREDTDWTDPFPVSTF